MTYSHRFRPRPVRWSLPGAIAVLLLGVVLAAGAARAADRARIEAFLDVTGFDVALDSIALSAADAPAILGLDAGEFGPEWSRLSREVFDTGAMRDMALSILEQTLDDAVLNHAVEFYASDLGQRLVKAENAAHMMEDDAAKQREGMEIVAGLVEQGAPRLDLLKRMNRAIDAADTSVRALQEIQFRFLMAASAAGVIELRADPDELRAMMQRNEGRLRRAMQQSALAGSAYTYQGFSDADLRAYAEALEQPDMQKVYELLNAVQYEIMANRFEALAARMSGLRPGQDI
ncbi:MAG: DUF2059 domain-containing protein [Rhodobacteraceae bacterium]|nr:DUF2059 domain-containing protein [Paracoccaceae bacterium]